MPQEKTAVEWNKSFLQNLAGEKEFADDDVPNEEKHENRESRSMLVSINQYEVISKIGHGSIGEIYHVRDSKTSQSYAIKTYPGDSLSAKAVKSRETNQHLLQMEMKHLRSISHPNIISLVEAIKDFNAPNSISLVYEYASSGPLMTMGTPEHDADTHYAVVSPSFSVGNTGTCFAEAEAGFILRQIISALIYLHQNHIAHRNVQIKNILLTPTHQVKITGMELSQNFSDQDPDCDTYGFSNETPGLWPMWSPEMCLSTLNDSSYSCFKADVWAVGVVLYTMIFGKMPFWHTDPGMLFDQIIDTTVSAQAFEFPFETSSSLCDLFELFFISDPRARPTFVDINENQWLQSSRDHPSRTMPEYKHHRSGDVDTVPGSSLYKSIDDSEGNTKSKLDKKMEEKKKKHKLMDANGHFWVPKYFNRPTWCKICDDFVYGLTKDMQKSYKCRNCKVAGHLKCVLKHNEHVECISLQSSEASIDSSNKKAVLKISHTYNPTPVPNHGGHVWRKKFLKTPTWCSVCNSFIYGLNKEQQNAYCCFLCKTVGHRNCCEYYNDHGCSIGHFGVQVKTPPPKNQLTRQSTDGEATHHEKLAMINQYEVTHEVGHGRVDGSITVVTDTTDPEKPSYAMKSYPGEKLKVPPFVFRRKDMHRISESDRMHQEILLMRKMVHPNLQMIRDVISENVEPYNVHMVLELVNGGPILDSKQVDAGVSPTFFVPGTDDVYNEEYASIIVRQLLSALVYLERNHIAHRNLKPENILITKKGLVKLTDFGESSDFSSGSTEDERLGMVTDTKGTWPFWAPEMCDDTVEDGGKFSAYKADVWAAGVVLYTMLLGQLPFWHPEPDSLFEEIMSTKTSKISPEYPEGTSAEYIHLLESMLTPDPENRPSFQECEKFEWLQMHSNEENEKKLSEASNLLIRHEEFSKVKFTPGNSFYLAVDSDQGGKPALYKNLSGNKQGDVDDSTLSPEELEEKRQPPKDINGHVWKSKYLNKPTWCKVCNNFIWGLTEEQQDAFKCTVCKTVGHRRCCKVLNEETECVPAVKKSSIGLNSLSTFQKKSLRKLVDKPDRNWNILRNFVKLDSLGDVVVDAVKEGLSPPPNVNGHVWRSKYLTKPTWCKVCDSFIFGITKDQQNAYKCFLCKVSAHRDCCIKHNDVKCTGGRRPEKTKDETSQEEEKEQLAMINQYEVIKELGRGAFGKVYLIADSTSHPRRHYAMKTFPGSKLKAKKLGRSANKGPSEADIIKFEIVIMKAMSHPNIVSLADAIEETVSPNNVHLVLELVDGGQLMDSKNSHDNFLSPSFFVPGTDKAYTEETASVLFRQLLSALVYLENNHIAHRDLKPENVLITKKGVAKLTDFGVSADFSSGSTEDERLGMVTDTKGTWPFWAPEMCDDTVEDGGKFSAYKADVWAAGVVLYTMLLGQLPFWHPEPDSLFEEIMSTKTSKISPEYPEGTSAEYIHLLESMLTPDPENRPSFQECEKFEWLQMHSNEENEKKLSEASHSMIDGARDINDLEFTPGNSYFLVPDDNNVSNSFYKKNKMDGDCESSDGHAHHDTPSKSKKAPPEDKNGHMWKAKYLNKPTWCKICSSFVWGVTEEQQGAYKCSNCKTVGHRHCCVKLSEANCIDSRDNASRLTTSSSDQESEELVDMNGHCWHQKHLSKPRWCEICQSFIYVVKNEQQAFKCSACKTVGHKDCCVQKNLSQCMGLDHAKSAESSASMSSTDSSSSINTFIKGVRRLKAITRSRSDHDSNVQADPGVR